LRQQENLLAFMNSPVILLFTSSFPYRKEESFLENELPVLCSKAGHVYIFPDRTGDIARPIPGNATVVYLDRKNYSFYKSVFNNPLTLFSLILTYPLRRIGIRYFIKQVSFLLRDNYVAQQIEAWMQQNCKGKDVICYAYWFSNMATRLSILKKKKIIKHFISRAHRFDLYTEVNHYNFIPNRLFQLRYADKVYAVAGAGAAYLKERYPQFAAKVAVSYLGTQNYGRQQGTDPGTFTLVSVANFKAFKRIHLIVEILKYVDVPVTWIHFGEGPLMNEVLEKVRALPVNIHCDFRGHCTNAEVMEFYRNSYVHLFINVSSTEGLPVSIMEAMSFGIPVMATNVGGVSEIVNTETGYLLDPSFDPAACAGIIKEVDAMRNSEKYHQLRFRVRQFWENNLEATSAYSRFYEAISQYAQKL